MLDISQLCPDCNKEFGGSKKDHDCVRNIDISDSIGNEKKWVEQCVTELHERGLEVNIATTDPDASAFKEVENAYKKSDSKSPPKHQLDTRHVGAN